MPLWYSDEEKRRIAEARSGFEAVKRSGALGDPAFAKLYRDDIAFVQDALERADRTDLDTGSITGLETSVRRLMDVRYEASKDPALAPEKRPWGGDIAQANTALKAATVVDQEARAVQTEVAHAAAAIPLEYKVAGGIAVVLVLAILLR